MFEYFVDLLDRYLVRPLSPSGYLLTVDCSDSNISDDEIVSKLADFSSAYVQIQPDPDASRLDTDDPFPSFYQRFPISIELATFMGLVPENCSVSMADAIKSIHDYLKLNKLQWSKHLFVPDDRLRQLLRLAPIDRPLQSTVPDQVSEIRWSDVPRMLVEHFRIYSLIVTTYPTTTHYVFIPRRLFTTTLRDRASTENSFPFVSESYPDGIENGDRGVFGYTMDFDGVRHFRFPENILIDQIYTYYT